MPAGTLQLVAPATIKRRPAKKKTKVKAKKGLTKVEKSQVNALIKKSEETKYFDCHDAISGHSLRRARANINGIGVRGYATCQDKNSQGTRVQYGVNSGTNAHEYLDELNMDRTFSNSGGNDHENAQAVIGCYANPSYTASSFVLERQFIHANTIAGNPTSLDAAPYFVRVLRISPLAKKLSTVTINPETDAFMSKTGEAIGIANSDFGPTELMLSKANSRKYKVIADTKFMMDAPFAVTNNATGTTPATDAIISSMGTKHTKMLNFKHDIGKKLYFANGSHGGRANATAGQKNEFILIHTCQVGVNSQSDLTANSALEMKIGGRFISSYKE